jgi:hypothetical protein
MGYRDLVDEAGFSRLSGEFGGRSVAKSTTLGDSHGYETDWKTQSSIH